jgi:hypothetical protein
LNTTVEKITEPRFCYAAEYSESVGGGVGLDENLPAVNEIIGNFGARNNIASITAADERVNIEGVVNTTVLYQADDGEINSVDVEIPYSVDVRDQKIAEGFRLEGNGAVGTVAVKRKKDRELDVSAELFFGVQAYCNQTVSVVVEVEEANEKVDAANAVSVYNAEAGETLWDVAKALSCAPETILNQNESLVFPIKNPGKVILYRELTEN